MAQFRIPAVLSLFLFFLSILSTGTAHVVFPPSLTRAKCYHDGATTDIAYRGTPCGRASRGTRGVLVAGASVCLRIDMVVPHSGEMRIAVAPGTAPAGPNQRGTPTDTWETFLSQSVLAVWPCEGLPSCPGIARTGQYALPINIPQDLLTRTVAAGGTLGGNNSVVATLQVRQGAPEYNWFYYDCSDVLIVNSTADIPTDLLAAWREMEGPCPGGIAFKERTYPFTWYIEQSIVLGVIFLLALVLVLGITGVFCLRAYRGQVDTKADGKGPLHTDPVTAQGDRSLPALCRGCCTQARQQWKLLLGLLLVDAVALGIAGGVLSEMPTCAFRPSPGFGP